MANFVNDVGWRHLPLQQPESLDTGRARGILKLAEEGGVDGYDNALNQIQILLLAKIELDKREEAVTRLRLQIGFKEAKIADLEESVKEISDELKILKSEKIIEKTEERIFSLRKRMYVLGAILFPLVVLFVIMYAFSR